MVEETPSSEEEEKPEGNGEEAVEEKAKELEEKGD